MCRANRSSVYGNANEDDGVEDMCMSTNTHRRSMDGVVSASNENETINTMIFTSRVNDSCSAVGQHGEQQRQLDLGIHIEQHSGGAIAG